MNITWIGHSCFFLKAMDTRLLQIHMKMDMFLG